MNYTLTVGLAVSLLQATCLNYDLEQAAQVIDREFFRKGFWQMPSVAQTGNVIFVTKREAKRNAVLVPIPIMVIERVGQHVVACNDLKMDRSQFMAFVLDRNQPVAIMTLFGNLAGISIEGEDVDAKALYRTYQLQPKSFFYCSTVNRFAYIDQGQLYVWNAEIQQFNSLIP
ncbi:hypothetical protein [Hymenobacter koreensis]|uniref:CheW-like domain-containing protein n=1 Tax=Hymenobacter koreensis TaxID=1084523 RepID=A0ABP8IUR7_9BACT